MATCLTEIFTQQQKNRGGWAHVLLNERGEREREWIYLTKRCPFFFIIMRTAFYFICICDPFWPSGCFFFFLTPTRLGQLTHFLIVCVCVREAERNRRIADDNFVIVVSIEFEYF